MLHNIKEGSYDILYKAEGYHDAGFEITIVPAGETTFTHDLVPIAKGEIWFGSPETEIPTAIYLESPEDFTLYISNTGDVDVEYAIRIEFESVDMPEQISFLFPTADSELVWSNVIPSGAYTVNYATVTLPPEAIPADMDEATYDVYVRLLAR
ncbi:MAG: hypothetical protein U9N61_02070 [Euryarchaeota archaeon]|nr:hypothetical protein [Euryarchaeota archaeon]